MKKTGGGGGGGGSGGGVAGDKKRGRRSYADSSTDTPPRVSFSSQFMVELYPHLGL